MFKQLLKTDNDPAVLALRVALGLVIKDGGLWSVEGVFGLKRPAGHRDGQISY